MKEIADINKEAFVLSKNINVLGALAWHPSLEKEFLEGWNKGNPKIPVQQYAKVDYSDLRQKLTDLTVRLSDQEPLSIYTKKTIESYIEATLLVESIGTPEFQKRSIQMYGKPGNQLAGSTTTSTKTARKILKVLKRFDHPYIKEPEICVSAEYVAKEIEVARQLLGEDMPEVRIIENFSAKAAASLSVIKLRKGTCFTKYDAQQLLQHEILIHSLTAINGSRQKIVSIMGRGSPRTTSTQEGLATFSEVITGAIDLKRLIRLALRVIAIEKALNGADFIDIFKYFLANEQGEKESFWSTARIFRGGNPYGGSVFTKDCIYIDGLMHISAFFQWALHENQSGLLHFLFCGRLALEDIFLLKDELANGNITPPKYLPEWYQNIESLAGSLAFSISNTKFDLKSLNSYFDAYLNK